MKSKVVIQAGWDDAPWLSEQKKQELEKDTPDHLKQARRQGIPAMGSGNVYPYNFDDMVVEGFTIPAHYKRMFALDVGWKRTAILFAAINPEDGTVYIYSEHYQGHEEPAIHAKAIRERYKAAGYEFPGVIDPSAGNSTQIDGKKLLQIYRVENGLRQIVPANNEVEAGIYMVKEAISTGKLKIFKGLINLRKEYMIYHRDVNGRIVKEDDHLMDALRYIILNQKYAKQKPIIRGDKNDARSGRDYFGDR